MGWVDQRKWVGARGWVVALAISIGTMLAYPATVVAVDTDNSESPAESMESQRERTSVEIEDNSASEVPTSDWRTMSDNMTVGLGAASRRREQSPQLDTSRWLAIGEKAHEDQAGAAAPTSGGGTDAHKGTSLEEIGNKLNNPGSDLASLNFQFVWKQYKGDLPGSSSQNSLVMNFQPVLPFKLADGGNFLVRPSIPLVWQPHFDAGKGGFDEQFGLGDSQLVAFYSRTNTEKGFMWGLGATMQFPTHTDDVLGKDQFQMGPAAFVGMMGKWGSVGVFPQHWWNIGGSGEGYTALTAVQPWYWFSVDTGWQVGGSPTITYDWAADYSDEAWTVPINLGVAKTIKVGKTPVKLKLEAIYYIVQPDSFGPHWGLQLTITPVVPNVLAGLFK